MVATIEAAEKAVSQARADLADVKSQITLARGRATQAKHRREKRALAASRGDATARADLEKAREAALKAALALEDLEAAEREAAAEAERAEAELRRAREVERADRIETKAAAFHAANAEVDQAVEALGEAFLRAREAADALTRAAPELVRQGVMANIMSRARATRGLADLREHVELESFFSQHAAPVAESRDVGPLVERLVGELRGEAAGEDRSEAA